MFIDFDAEYNEWVMIFSNGQVEYLAPGSYSRSQAELAADEILEMLVDEV